MFQRNKSIHSSSCYALNLIPLRAVELALTRGEFQTPMVRQAGHVRCERRSKLAWTSGTARTILQSVKIVTLS